MTKMIFRPSNKISKRRVSGWRSKLGRSWKILGTLAVLFLAIFLLSRNSFSGIFSRSAENIAAPVWRGGNAVRGESLGLFPFFSTKEVLILQTQELQKKNKTLEQNLIGYDAAIREVVDLRQMLHRNDSPDILLAGVLSEGSGSSLPFDTLHVDAGKNLSINEGDLVIAGVEDGAASTSLSSRNLIAIGTVTEVTGGASKVKLFSSAGEKTQVFLGPENISVALLGQGGGTFSVELPKDADVKVGDTALLPGVSGHIVAVVAALEPDPSLSFVTVYLRLPVNPSQLRYVGILRTQKTNKENE